MKEIFDLISQQGFAIVAAVGVFVAFYKTTQQNREDIAKINEQHRAEMEIYAKQLSNNTEAITRLTDKLDELLRVKE